MNTSACKNGNLIFYIKHLILKKSCLFYIETIFTFLNNLSNNINCCQFMKLILSVLCTKKVLKVIVIFLILLQANEIFAQQKTITGKVVNDSNAILNGVSVQIKGTSKGTITNNNGIYSIAASDNDMLVFSYVGYKPQTITVNGKTEINVTLVSAGTQLNDVVVVGYGTQRKIDVTGSVAHVRGTELVKQPVLTATQALQSKVAGVQIISSGQPGSSPQVIIRGAGSILAGVNPLYVVDGVILPQGSDITNINTADIASVDVLKDASSSAIYGARAANGVILITTKQGSGKMNVSYSLNMGLTQAAYVVPMANATEYATYQQATTGLPFQPTGYSTTWYNQVLRNALYQTHNVSVSGSNEKDRYLFNVGYFDQDGIIIANNYKRYTIRFNNEFTPTSFIKIGTTASFANGTSQNVPTGTITEDAYRAAPTVPAILNGKYGNTSQYQNVGNPVLDAYNTDDLSHDNRAQGNFYIEVKPVSFLTLRSNIGGEIDFADDRAYTYQHPNDTTFFNTNGGTQGANRSTLSVVNNKNYDWVWDNTITFDKRFGLSRLTVLAGTTAEEYYATGINGIRYYVPPVQSEWYLNSGNANQQVNGSTQDKYTRQSYLGRIFYSFNDKYQVTATFRRDASSVFTENNRWGNFPGISAGWVISKEQFMERQNIFQYLKLRAGYGELGNSNIASDAAFATTLSNLPYFYGTGNQTGTAVTGSIVPQIKDQNIKWEITKEADIGLEFAILKSKLTGELDVYDKKVDNALINIYVPGTFGSQSNPNSSIAPGYVIANAASIENKGLEISVRWQDNINENISYFIGGNVSFNKNRVMNLNGGVPFYDGNINGYFITQTKTGYPIGAFFVRQVLGVFQNQQQIDNYKDKNGNLLQGGAQPGDFIYKYNDNGTLDTAYAGSYQPKAYLGINGGLNYKNLDFSFDIYANIGNQVYNGKLQARVVQTDNIEKTVATGYWSPSNPSNTQPRANGGNLPASTYFVASGTFARLNNVTLGYTLPARILNNTRIIKGFRFFLNGQNLATLKKYKGFSSELPGSSATNAGIELSTYPTIRTFAAGLNVNF